MKRIFGIINNYFLLPLRIKKVFANYKYKGKASLYQRILYCPVTPSALNLARESIYAHYTSQQVEQAGIFLFDKKSLRFDYKFKTANGKMKGVYFFLAKLFVRLCGHSLVTFSQFYKEDSYKEARKIIQNSHYKDLIEFKYGDVLIGDLAVSSSIRTTLGNGPEWDNPAFIDLFKEYLYSAYCFADVFTKVLESFKPDKVVMSHAIYVTWGTLFRVARSKNIPVDVYNGSYQRNTLRFYHNIPNAPIPDGNWESYAQKELTKEELELTEKYIASREDNSMDNIQLFDKEANTSKLNDFIKTAKSDGKTLFCLFTNIVWDAYMFAEEDANDTLDTLSWLKLTIDKIVKEDKAALIIKAHPAEEFHQVPQKYRIKNLLKEICEELPSNIFFIDEMTKIKPYGIYKQIDYGLAFISTVIIEMALQGVPVICAGPGGQYSGKGFTVDRSTKSEYEAALKQAMHKELVFVPDIERAKRFLYFRFYREAIPFHFIFFEKNYMFVRDIPEVIQKEGLDTISEGILYDQEYIFDWTLKN